MAEDTQGAMGNQGGASNDGQGNAGDQSGQGNQGDQSVLGGGQGGAGGQAGAGGTGEQIPGWLNEAPENFRGNKVFHNIKGSNLKEALPMILTNYDNAQRFIGRSVSLPKDGDSPQKIQEFKSKMFNYLGRPKTAEEYSYETPEVNGELLNSEIVNDFVAKAHARGFTNDQLQFVLNEYANVQNGIMENHQRGIRESLELFRDELGPRSTRLLVLAQRAAKELGGSELAEMLDRTGLGNDPRLIRAFIAAGEMMAESGYIPGEVVGTGTENAQQAQARIAEIMSNKSHPYHEKSNSQAHKDAVAEMQRLHQIAYPEPKK